MSWRKAAAASAKRRTQKKMKQPPDIYNTTLNKIYNGTVPSETVPSETVPSETSQNPSILFTDDTLVIRPEINRVQLRGENIEKFQIEIKSLFAWTEYDTGTQTRFMFLVKLPKKLFHKDQIINGWANGYEKIIGGTERWVPFYVSSGKNSSNIGDSINRKGHAHPLYGLLRRGHAKSVFGYFINKFIDSQLSSHEKKEKILPDAEIDSWMIKCDIMNFFTNYIILGFYRKKKNPSGKDKKIKKRLEDSYDWNLWKLPDLSYKNLVILDSLVEKTIISVSSGNEVYDENNDIPYLCATKTEALSNIIGEYLNFNIYNDSNVSIDLIKGQWNKNKRKYNFIAFDEKKNPILDIQTSIISTHNPFGVSFKKRPLYNESSNKLYRILINNETIDGINENKTWAKDFKDFMEIEKPGSWEGANVPQMIKNIPYLYTMSELIHIILKQYKENNGRVKGGNKSKKKKTKRRKKIKKTKKTQYK